MENAKAILKMKKIILEGAQCDEEIHSCSVLKYDYDRDCMYLILEGNEIDQISLDGIYECTICKGEETVASEGKIVERYCNQNGNILVFQVEKGFYKININCVDKEEAQ